MSTVLSPNLLNVTEAAELIGCDPSRVRQLLREGGLKGIKVHSRAWLVDKKSAEKVRDLPHETGRPRKSKNIS